MHPLPATVVRHAATPKAGPAGWGPILISMNLTKKGYIAIPLAGRKKKEAS
jgi:hypothetical protein